MKVGDKVVLINEEFPFDKVGDILTVVKVGSSIISCLRTNSKHYGLWNYFISSVRRLTPLEELL